MNSAVNNFLKKIMEINVATMGGATAGIIGTSGTGSDVINNLKRTSISFAREYSKQNPSQPELKRLEHQIVGQLRILQLTYTLSEHTVNTIVDELQALAIIIT
jgi:hypothetical protein